MKKKPTRPAIIVFVVVGLIAYLALGYFLVISPQRSKSADLGKQVADTEAQINQYRTLSAQAKAAAPIRVADLFRLEKAMPNEVDMAGIVLELSRIAGDTGITLRVDHSPGSRRCAGLPGAARVASSSTATTSSCPTSCIAYAPSSACEPAAWLRPAGSSSSTRSASRRARRRSRVFRLRSS